MVLDLKLGYYAMCLKCSKCTSILEKAIIMGREASSKMLSTISMAVLMQSRFLLLGCIFHLCSALTAFLFIPYKE